MKCTITILDEINCRFAGLRPEHLKLMREKFGVYVDGYRWMPAFQLGRWDGKVYFFDEKGNTYTKILDECLPYVITWGYEVDLVDEREPAPVITDIIDEDFFKLDHFKLRDYQMNAVNLLLKEGSGFAVLATGAGKTSLTAALAMVLYQNKLQTIIIVPSSDLVSQTIIECQDRLQKHDVTIGQYSGSHKDIDHPIVVATWQSLQNVPHNMKHFQAVIVDECHGLRGSVVRSLITEYGSHISHRYGLTGTFPKAQTDAYSLKLSIGQVLIEVSASYLIERGFLSTIDIETVETQDEDTELPDYASETAYLSQHEERLAKIAELIMKKRDQYGNTLVLVNSIPLGRMLKELIPDSEFLSGESASDLRKSNYQEFADKDGIIKIATVGIAGTGISIDRIFCEVLVDMKKSFIKVIQSIGRGLRKKGDKNHIHLVDLYSRLKFAKKHASERKKFYKEAKYEITSVKKLKY